MNKNRINKNNRGYESHCDALSVDMKLIVFEPFQMVQKMNGFTLKTQKLNLFAKYEVKQEQALRKQTRYISCMSLNCITKIKKKNRSTAGCFLNSKIGF